MRSPGQPASGLITAVVIGLAVWGLIATRRNGSVTIASGEFHQVAHKGMGRAEIIRRANGEHTLRLSDVRTYPAADLEIRLIAAPDAFDNETVEKSEPVSLGQLQTTNGDQVCALPNELDLTRYRALTIWSRKHGVNFTTAPLVPR